MRRMVIAIMRARSRVLASLAALAVLHCSSRSSSRSSGKSIAAFSFLKANNGIPVDSPATISGTSIQAFLPPGTGLTSLKATFAVSGKATVTVGGRSQTSSVTGDDFSSAVSYLVIAEDGSSQTYAVQVVTDLAAFDDAVQGFMSKYAVPAASIAVTSGEKLVYLKAYGLQDTQAAQKATPQSLFRLASVSKPITSIAIMKLIEQGKLHLGDTIFGATGVLGTSYGTPPYGPHITEITLDQLLHHTSGGWPNDGTDPMFSNPAMSAAQLISWTLDNRPLNYAPGINYAYSNFGYCVLGRVIEKVTNQTYEDAVKGLVLQPLGITDMTIGGNTLAGRLPDEVKYYGQGEDPYAFNLHRMDSHGGWVATAKDLANILVHADGFAAKADILTAQSIATMTTPSSANAKYACGWAVNSANNWWHLGSLPGTETEIIRAAIGWNWVMLVNTRSADANYASDLDGLFWTAKSHLVAVPAYDLF